MGIAQIMTQAQHIFPAASEESDLRQVLRTLHRTGPLPLSELHNEPNLVDWPEARVEHALVAAWSRNLISIDSGDLLVAL